MKKEEITLTEEQLATLRIFFQKHTGLFFPEHRFTEKLKDISAIVSASPQSAFLGFLPFLTTPGGGRYLKKIKALFVEKELLFFQTSPHMERVKHLILPEILKREEKTKKIAIWSAGCSTGEEPYTIAFFLQELIEDPENWKITITATDIDRKVLKTAKEGRYPKWSFHGVDKKIIEKFFIRENDEYLIKENYRRMIHFSSHSLNTSALPVKVTKAGGMDLILFRNVSTLLEAKTTRSLAKTFYKILNKQGFLVTGKHEHSDSFYANFSPRIFPDATIYQKSGMTATTANRHKKQPDDIDPIDLVIENETKTLLSVIKENDLSQFKTKEELSLHENRKGSSKKSEETQTFDQAIQHFNKKKYNSAIDSFITILDINCANARACWMLCHIYAMKGLYDEAIAWGTRCIAIDPLDKAPYYTLALSYIGKGKLNEAAEKIKKAIYIDPKFTLGYFTLGNIYILLHLSSQANHITDREEFLSSSTLSKELSFKTKSISVRKLLGELQLKPRSLQEDDR